MKTVIEMARSVGATAYTNRHYPERPTHTFSVDQLERFAELIRADERAKMAEQLGQRTWVDPNDKTQKQYLPHIGEPVLFCHKGMTYMGKHTGGSFQSEVTNQYFNTWECHWMYLPAANSIKEKT